MRTGRSKSVSCDQGQPYLDYKFCTAVIYQLCSFVGPRTESEVSHRLGKRQESYPPFTVRSISEQQSHML